MREGGKQNGSWKPTDGERVARGGERRWKDEHAEGAGG